MRAQYVQVMTSCAGGQAGQIGQYHAKLERVKFGVSLDQVCRPDLPGPLLVSSQCANSGGINSVISFM